MPQCPDPNQQMRIMGAQVVEPRPMDTWGLGEKENCGFDLFVVTDSRAMQVCVCGSGAGEVLRAGGLVGLWLRPVRRNRQPRHAGGGEETMFGVGCGRAVVWICYHNRHPYHAGVLEEDIA